MTPSQYDRTELERLIDYFFTQMLSGNDVDYLQVEDALMEHFDPLFFLLADDNEIARLTEYLSKIDHLSLRQAKHCDYLRYYKGVVARDKQEYAIAEDIFQNLLAEAEIDTRLQARVLNALGMLYDFSSRFDAAIIQYHNCAEAYQRIGDASGEGKALKNQGIVHLELGEYNQARSLFICAQKLFQQTNDPTLECRVLLELGYADRELGNWAEALKCYQQGRQIAQALENNDMLARFSNNLGSVYCLIGNWAEAELYHQQALDLARNLPENEQREIADICHNLGFLMLVQQKFTPAYDYYESALLHAQQAQELTAISEIYYRLGDFWQRQADQQRAYAAYQQGINTVEQMLGQVSQETVRISVMGIRQQLYQAMVLCCLSLQEVDQAFSYVQQAKSRAFLDILSCSSAKAVEYAQLPLTTQQIQARLPDETTLIEFFATGQAGPNEEMLTKLPRQTQFLRAYLTPVERLFAFIVTEDSLALVELDITLRQLEARHFQRRNGRLRGTDPVAGQLLSSLHWWHQLDGQLLEPIRPFLRNCRHLFFAPHGALHYLPLHALAVSGQLVENASLTVSYIPSASVLLQGSLAASSSIFSKGQAAFTPYESLAIGVDLDGLTYSEAEATWVAQHLDGQLLLGSAATITKVCGLLPAAKIIHFSCHGLFHNHRTMASALRLADGVLTAADILQTVRLQAELITLSACDTGLNPLAHGDELMGLTRALLGAGARTLLMTLWQVLELPTRLFIEHFYQAWLKGMSRSGALLVAQHTLRSLTVAELHDLFLEYGLATDQINEIVAQFVKMCPGEQPFNHPYYWGAFVIVGDPS